ncbi:hypothetical protein KMJ87_002132, partial [Neisseria gonorrhoeae]
FPAICRDSGNTRQRLIFDLFLTFGQKDGFGNLRAGILFPPERTTPPALQTLKRQAARVDPGGRGKSLTA